MININAKIFNKILEKQIQNPFSYTMIKLDSSQGLKDGSTYANQSMWYTIATKEN